MYDFGKVCVPVNVFLKNIIVISIVTFLRSGYINMMGRGYYKIWDWNLND